MTAAPVIIAHHHTNQARSYPLPDTDELAHTLAAAPILAAALTNPGTPARPTDPHQPARTLYIVAAGAVTRWTSTTPGRWTRS